MSWSTYGNRVKSALKFTPPEHAKEPVVTKKVSQGAKPSGNKSGTRLHLAQDQKDMLADALGEDINDAEEWFWSMPLDEQRWAYENLDTYADWKNWVEKMKRRQNVEPGLGAFIPTLTYKQLSMVGKERRAELKKIGKLSHDYPEERLNAPEQDALYTLLKDWLGQDPSMWQPLGMQGKSNWYLKAEYLAHGIIQLSVFRELKSSQPVGHLTIRPSDAINPIIKSPFSVVAPKYDKLETEINIAPFNADTANILLVGFLSHARDYLDAQGKL